MEKPSILQSIKDGMSASSSSSQTTSEDVEPAKPEPFIYKLIGGVVSITFVGWLLGVGPFANHTTNDPADSSSFSTPHSSAAPSKLAMPEDETLFVRAVVNGRSVFKAGSNDMAKGAARPRRARELCSSRSTYDVSDWTGTVSELSSNGSGKGVLSVDLGSGASVHTNNNDISEMIHRTLIPPDSDLYQSVVQLHVGSKVIFSGMLFKGQDDCFEETSLTQEGSMTQPEFLMRFESVDPIR